MVSVTHTWLMANWKQHLYFFSCHTSTMVKFIECITNKLNWQSILSSKIQQKLHWQWYVVKSTSLSCGIFLKTSPPRCSEKSCAVLSRELMWAVWNHLQCFLWGESNLSFSAHIITTLANENRDESNLFSPFEHLHMLGVLPLSKPSCPVCMQAQKPQLPHETLLV